MCATTAVAYGVILIGTKNKCKLDAQRGETNMHYSTKTYGNDRGLSCCFRQWRAHHSHCHLLHGYSIGIKITFASPLLDDRNWVYDFGGLDAFKGWATYMFDHTLVVALDDPELEHLQHLDANTSLVDLRILPAVGCEKFAQYAFETMTSILEAYKRDTPWLLLSQQGEVLGSYELPYRLGSDVRVYSVEVFEHGANSAIYEL